MNFSGEIGFMDMMIIGVCSMMLVTMILVHMKDMK